MTMDPLQCLLICLGEEAAEVSQRVSKVLRFGLNEVQPGQSKTNRERLEEELGDLLGVVEALGLTPNMAKKEAKLYRLGVYMSLSMELGEVEDTGPQDPYNVKHVFGDLSGQLGGGPDNCPGFAPDNDACSHCFHCGNSLEDHRE